MIEIDATMTEATATQDDMIFNGQNQEQEQERSARLPLFSSDRGAAWIEQDKNEDYYLSVQVDLGLLGTHNLALFCDDALKETFNKFCSHAEDQDLAKETNGGGAQ